MNDYRIELGIGLKADDLAEIKKKINSLEDNPIKLKVDAETTELTRTIKEALNGLSKGSKNALTPDTSKLEGSIADIRDAVVDLKKVFGSLDDGANFKPLLSSINQIANALGKVENESDNLVKSLSALSKRDFNINFGIDMGKKNNNMIAYGRAARKQVIPELEAQIKELEGLFGGQQATMRKLTTHGKNVGFDIFTDFGDFNSDSAIKKMEAMEKYIDSLKKLAVIDNVKLDGFNEVHKNASELIDDIAGVESAVDKAGDVPDKIKKFFGSGLDVESLSGQLQPIITDLNEIKTAIQSLSSGISVDGLTQSFDRLSDTLERLTSNLSLAKNTLDTGFSGVSNISSGAIDNIEKISDSSTVAIVQNEKKKQEAYKATADTVMYHAGVISKLNKAETNGRFYGSNRGTGYFGTGHYFVDSATKHELDNSPSYRNLPYTSIDISQYDNLFKVTNDEIGYALHSFLGNLTRFTQGSDNFDADELFAQFKKVFGDTVMDIKEFGSRVDKLKTFMTNSNHYDRSDSVSTQFMKSLGYGGVDTRGTSLADTRYGTVIYDLKEESVLQANITDELQKQGQMLEKINYERGQVFDRETDARIQSKLNEEVKRKETIAEFEKSFDSTNLDFASESLDNAKNRIKELDKCINECQYSLNNLDEEYKDYVRDMSVMGLDEEDLLLIEDEDEWKNGRLEAYKDYINEASQEKERLQSEIPALEEVYTRESQLANEAYEQAKQVVEQRHKEAQQAQETANTVVQSEERKQQAIKQTDDILDQQTLALMNKFSISGDKGSDSFNKIRQALVECRNELNILKNSDIGIDEEVFDTSRAVDKVTDAIANQMRAVNSLGDEYIELANYMTRFNDPTKGNKVRLPDVVKQEQGDDYRSSRGSLGIAFNTERGISFVDFINDLNHELGETISLTNGEAAAMDELLRKVELGRKQRDAAKKSEKYLYNSLSTEEILEQNGINREEIYGDTMSAVDAVNTAEREAARISSETTNAVVKNEERKQQAYQETKRLISDVVQDSIDEVSSKSIDRAFRVDESDSIAFRREMENLVSQWTNAKGELTDIKIDTSTVYDKDTERHIEKIRQAQITYNNELGETIKKTIALRQIGTEVKVVDGKEMTSPMYGFVEVSGQYSKSLGKTKVQTDKFVKQQKKSVADLTNQINQLNRSAIDQNASRPIKDSAHLNSLSSKYGEITSAIQRMGNASSNTFDEEVSNVRTLISEYKSLTREFRNAENASSQMKGNDYESGRAIAKEKYEKFLADAKGFSVDTSKLDINSVTDVASLNKFTDALRVAKAELSKLKAEASSTKREIDSSNREKALGVDVNDLRRSIESLRKISPEINGFKTEINGAEVTVNSLLGSLGNINIQSDFRVARKNFESFTKAAQAAGIAVTETQKKSAEKKTSDEEVKKVNQTYKEIYDTRKRIGSLEVDLIGVEAKNDVKAVKDINDEVARLKANLASLDKNNIGSKFTDEQKSSLRELRKQIQYNKKQAQNSVDYKTGIQATKDEVQVAKAKARAEAKAINDTYNEMYNLKKKIGSLEVGLIKAEDTKYAKTLRDEVDRLKNSLSALDKDGISSKFTEKQKNSLKELEHQNKLAKNLAQNKVDAKLESQIDKEATAKAKREAKELEASFEKLKRLATEINSIEFKLAGLDDSKNEAEVNELVISLERLHREYDELFTATSKNLSGGQISQLDDIFAKAGDKLRQLDAQIADAKAELTQGIKIDIELGNFENEMDTMRTKFNGLSDANVELRTSVESVENAYQKMLKVANANTGDEVADRERLIQAEKEYAAALEKTNNLIKQQARADKIDADKIKLQDNREVFQSKIDTWMAKNSAATKRFGAELLDLRAKAESCDQVTLNHLEKQFKKIDNAADKAGLKVESLGDRIKSKFKEYMAYFSVAEVFMYVEQGLREMFNTVKEIDTAMTGLYRVTDLTASQYDTLFNNMISSAKEYGATLNDIINATTDWVRAGFDADTALGLAEVTTMYQHISDLDYDTAAENLITAYNGFKDELNGAFDGDTVGAVNYIADIFNELDRQNCP